MVDEPQFEISEDEAETGWYGKVFKAFDKQLKRDVALKVIKEERMGGPDAITHALAISKAGQHENVVTIYSVEKMDLLKSGNPQDVIVMQWVDGMTLDARLGKEQFSKQEAIQVSVGIIDGLAHLHRGNVAHGDLHIGNIMLTGDGIPKIIDVNAEQKAFLSQQTTSSRENAIGQDVGFCKRTVIKVLQHSEINGKSVNIVDTEMTRANSVQQLRDVVQRYAVGKSDLRVSHQPEGLFEQVQQLIEADKFPSLQMLLSKVTKQVCEKLSDAEFTINQDWNNDLAKQRIDNYFQLIEPLLPVFTACSYFGSKEACRLAGECIEAIANIYNELNPPTRVVKGWEYLQYYPAVLLFLSAGIGAWLSRNYLHLSILLRDFGFKKYNKRISLFQFLMEQRYLLEEVWGIAFFGCKNAKFAPFSNDMFHLLHSAIQDMSPKTKATFRDDFRSFEFFCGLELALSSEFDAFIYAAGGSYIEYYNTGYSETIDFGKQLLQEALQKGKSSSWDAFEFGFFGGDIEQLKSRINKFEEILPKIKG